jgi:hypothetical protein
MMCFWRGIFREVPAAATTTTAARSWSGVCIIAYSVGRARKQLEACILLNMKRGLRAVPGVRGLFLIMAVYIYDR